MPRPKNLVPSYRLHKPSGQAIAFVGRKTVYLGEHGSPESRRRYGELLAKLQKESENAAPPPPNISIAEMVLVYLAKELPRFSRSEAHCQKTAIRLLVQMFGEIPAKDFGPLKLRALRDAMIAGDPHATNAKGEPDPRKPWSRKTVNRQVKRVRAVFRWAVSQEMISINVVQSLDTLRVIKPGETSAAESMPRSAVPQEHIDAAREKLKPIHRAVFDLLRLTGARPGEILGLTMGMIDRRGDEWVVELLNHKNKHKEKARYLVFTAAAQRILLEHFHGDPEARLFPVRRDNFGAAVKRACEKAGVPAFCPHQLRHTAGTQVVDRLGIAEAQALLGHSSAQMTQHYARAAIEPAKRAARVLGETA